MYKKILRPILFAFDPEKVHHFSFRWIKFIFSIPIVPFFIRKMFAMEHPLLKRDFFGMTLKNPVGLAAGFDKNGELINELSYFGFGFIEVGTITPKPQEGNTKPRIFRLIDDKALINRMGFNNKGVFHLIDNLKKIRENKHVLIGGNIGKNKITTNELAKDDYTKCFEELYPYVDYFTVNVSSPNTPNLRELQEKGPLLDLLESIQKINFSKPKFKPIFLKIAPDVQNNLLDDIIEIVQKSKISGIIATNTTISRENLKTSQIEIEQIGAGGVSGKPVYKKSNEVIAYIKQKSNNQIFVIGVGGIMTPQDAIDKLKAGADLIQIYTGFIYNGPFFIKEINKKMIEYYKTL